MMGQIKRLKTNQLQKKTSHTEQVNRVQKI